MTESRLYIVNSNKYLGRLPVYSPPGTRLKSGLLNGRLFRARPVEEDESNSMKTYTGSTFLQLDITADVTKQSLRMDSIKQHGSNQPLTNTTQPVWVPKNDTIAIAREVQEGEEEKKEDDRGSLSFATLASATEEWEMISNHLREVSVEGHFLPPYIISLIAVWAVSPTLYLVDMALDKPWNGLSFRKAPQMSAVVWGREFALDGTKWWGYAPVRLYKNWVKVVGSAKPSRFEHLRERNLDMDNLWLPISLGENINLKLVHPKVGAEYSPAISKSTSKCNVDMLKCKDDTLTSKGNTLKTRDSLKEQCKTLKDKGDTAHKKWCCVIN